MKTLIKCFMLFATLISTSAFAGSVHQHGHGTLNIATEGKLILLELEVPGADLFGFETKAETDEQKAAVKKATDILNRPLELFVLPADAACKVENVSVKVEAEKGGEGHTEAHAEYALYCKKPTAIKSIDFKYFSKFSGAAEVKVNVVGSQGQKSYTVKKDKPNLDLGGTL
ncbi:MAG: DUF2796 domain-containing protein [Methyloligellaceae bacterium]